MCSGRGSLHGKIQVKSSQAFDFHLTLRSVTVELEGLAIMAAAVLMENQVEMAWSATATR
jgi:hypothetical protein